MLCSAPGAGWSGAAREKVRCFALRPVLIGRALPSRSCVTSLGARTRGEPSSAHCEQRLSERLTPCPCDPVCAGTGMRGHAGKGKSGQTTQREATQPLHFLSPTPHAAQRAVPGWRGGLGRVGADLASAGSMRPPPSPARHVSTARLATTHASREAAPTSARQETARQSSTARLTSTHQRSQPKTIKPSETHPDLAQSRCAGAAAHRPGRGHPNPACRAQCAAG